ncbi:MAG: YlbF family regulator [Butyricicoccus sp.]|nr:YlbF family regulator [Butyricicoccus sp.]
MDAITLFKQAAKALQDDPRYLALDAARKANDADTELQAMIAEFGNLNTAYQQAAMGTPEEQKQVGELQTKMNDLYGKIMGSATMTAYAEAQQEAEKLIGFIDRIISEAMNGGDPMLVEENPASCCTGGCSGCSGCSGSCG